LNVIVPIVLRDAMPLGPRCPNCAKRVPFGRTQWNLGKPFQCLRCEARLVVSSSNAAALGIGMLVTFWLFRDRFPPEWGGQFGLFALMVMVGLPITWAATRVRLAKVS
jgi:hypothetical protein